MYLHRTAIFYIIICLFNYGVFNNLQFTIIINGKKVVRTKSNIYNERTKNINKDRHMKKEKNKWLPFFVFNKARYINDRVIKKKKFHAHSAPNENNNYKESNNSHIYQIRKEILSSPGNIKSIIEKHVINKVLHGNINKYNSFSYICNIDEIYEQVTKLYEIYEQCNKLSLKLPKLFGLPIVLKDNIITKGIPTTAGSKILSNYKSSYDSTVVKKLKKHGAIIIGKTRLDEFAMGSCTGNVKNPFNEKYLSCGGSSGGSASCVGSKILNCSVNTDTGGSIRTPAALCGCIGLKPTYGRISRYGIIPYNEETDVVGLIVNNVYDCSILLDCLSGYDKNDLKSVHTKKKKYYFLLKKYEQSEIFKSEKPLKNMKFGYLSKDLLKRYFVDDVVCDHYDMVMKNIKDMGGILINTNIYKLVEYCYIYYMYSMIVANSNIARMNGINYNIPNINNENNFITKLRSNLIDENVLARIIGGSIISSYFEKNNKKRDFRRVFLIIKNKLISRLNKLFKHVNFILLPSLPRSNNIKGDCNMDISLSCEKYLKNKINLEKKCLDNMNSDNNDNKNKHNLCIENDNISNKYMYNTYMREIFLVISSITGFPSIVIPTGEFTKNFNEPQSFQLLNSKLNEHDLLKVALAYKDKMCVNKKLLHNLENRAS
ncbi:glutamyl-tRNA(Gln) amidotransferase subunit A, putative [Plasmodium yoelii]|uniref:Glutamyl-tRNA(Gln) amidotransferase subunit A n=2 Tax=Plasmodium yoelii TaxID=5861 RepID=A0AAF0B1F8_PLAYO|nr:glutamyl-tRNA(Gln) amidotransferase subunit A, putative [Plasmodium yoelii]WBY56428.1 glutamyl-tRNA(Gln) amidotransferase subunit A [Plasmodium yoelii yoelii]CDU17303.1 glutamyl-tRNA(Gln) amidotransferase subunit A, putative [Plasmodium yoelii]VTZ76544.1 glutamyl-tRNA(Gln) amidotransferase subunit A, putative [Plasmodium yoelii]|eukprot:XP_730803.2 glutamyl-tRNA(Gln) amidotransferase subunit A, putative [Plasmodium yoelii]